VNDRRAVASEFCVRKCRLRHFASFDLLSFHHATRKATAWWSQPGFPSYSQHLLQAVIKKGAIFPTGIFEHFLYRCGQSKADVASFTGFRHCLLCYTILTTWHAITAQHPEGIKVVVHPICVTVIPSIDSDLFTRDTGAFSRAFESSYAKDVSKFMSSTGRKSLLEHSPETRGR